MTRTRYSLTVRAEPGVDEVRALRAWLKRGLRDFGLRCVEITPEITKIGKEKHTMDMRQYASKYVKPDQVRDGPLQTRIVNVFEDERYGRPVLELEIGSQITLSNSNNSALIKAWGHESDNWIGQEIILELGTYKDWREDPPTEKETVRVRAVSPAKPAEAQSGSAAAGKPLPPSKPAAPRKDMNDEIPF
jgi:hypothetical protein